MTKHLDNAFGLCQFAFGDDNDQYHHFLKSDTIHLLEKEFTRLFAGGYRWRHEYTQCVVQNILYSSRHKIFYDPGLCSRIMQFTLPDVPPDILLDIETPDPEELAFIKFKPNRKDSDGTMFAEELFTPPIFSERQSEEDENETPESDPETHWLHEYRNKRFPTRPEETPLAGKKDVLRELIKTTEDTGKLLNGIRENSDRYSDNDMQIKSDFPSGLNQKEALREGSIEFLPIEDNEFPEDELLDPFDKKRVVQLTDHYNSQDQDTHPIVKISSDQENPSAQKSGYNADEEIPTFGRIRGEDNEDVNFRWNAKHRTKFMDDDLTRFAKGDPARQERVKNLNFEPESTDNNNLSDIDILYNFPTDVIENDYLEDQLYAIFPTAKGMPTFTRDMRYDTKKPGPTYMLHDDEDGDTSHDDEEMAGQEMDRFLSHLTQNVEHNQLLSLLKSPVGVHKSYNTFVPNFEVTDETRRIFVTSGIPSMPEEVFGSKDGSVKLPERQQSFERPPADQPELLEGIDDEKSKEVRGDEEKPTNAAKTGEGHVGHYDNVASTHTYLLIKEKNIGEEKAQELVDTLIKILEGRQITFKVNPNALNMNASEVATKAEEHSSHLRELTGLTIEAAGIGDKVKYEVINPEKDKRMFIIAFALCGAVAGVVLAAGTAYLVRRHTRSREKLHNMTQPDTEASQDYQDLCRQRMASKANEKPEPVHTVHSPKKIRSLSQEGQASSSSHSSTSSW
nr:uncharacterized protein LOC122269256 [Parasteatoda tepidariorum]